MIVGSCKQSAGYQIDYETTNSLSFLLVRRAKLARHENDHARDWRRVRMHSLTKSEGENARSLVTRNLRKPSSQTDLSQILGSRSGASWPCS